MVRALAVVFVCVTVVTVACGGSGDEEPTATVDATPTVDAQRTPFEDAQLDEVIELAVALGTMTEPQATCVFRDHPSIYRAFLQESGLNESGVYEQETVRAQLEALKRDYAVQLDRCFTVPGT